MSGFPEEQLAARMRLLPPAPEAWVKAAQELPLALRGLDQIVERFRRDEEFRRAVLDDLEAALTREGFEVDPPLVDALRARLTEI
jgi:hypothetical protein